jgi:hypothetical protein
MKPIPLGGMLSIILLACVISLQGQDAPPQCKKDTLDKYAKTECIFGNLDFKFGEIPAGFVQFAKVTTVTPVENGLNFMFPPEGGSDEGSMTQPPAISYQTSFAFQVKPLKKPVSTVAISGNQVTININKGLGLVSASLLIDPQEGKGRETLSLTGLTASSVVFSDPAKVNAFISVENQFEVHTGGGQNSDALDAPAEKKMLSFTDTFVP